MGEKETTNQNKEKNKNTDIAYQNKDIVSKVMAEEFEGKSFAVYGIDVPKIVSVEPTNLPAIEANELRMDNLFLLEDGTYALVDYESEYRRENIFKYLSYVVRASERLYNKSRNMPKIRMIVIYTADVLRGTTRSETDMYSLTFTLTEAFLSELDCSAVRRTIEEIVNTRQDVTSEEMMQLIIYPLAFRDPNDKQSAIRQVIELAKKLNNEKKKYFILKCLMVFTDKIIRDEEARQIMEVLMLTKVERLMYEEMAKDIARKLLRKGDDVDTVSECTNLPRDIVVQLVEDIAREKEQQ